MLLFVVVLLRLCQCQALESEVCTPKEAPNIWSKHSGTFTVRENSNAEIPSESDMTSFDARIGEFTEGTSSWNLWHHSWETVSHTTLDLLPEDLTHGITFDIVQHYKVSKPRCSVTFQVDMRTSN